ncbi:hypothetical protein G6F68_016444 [Rhizopus microsporus]|nr:hypothetical protein G6F68_016444 [Rhizopus microsporus]
MFGARGRAGELSAAFRQGPPRLGRLDHVVGAGAVAAGGPAHDGQQFGIGQGADVGRIVSVHDEDQRADGAGVGRAIDPAGQLGPRGHLAFPEGGEIGGHLVAGQAVDDAPAGTPAVQPEDKARAFRRAAVHARPQAQRPVVPAQGRQAAPADVEADEAQAGAVQAGAVQEEANPRPSSEERPV